MAAPNIVIVVDQAPGIDGCRLVEVEDGFGKSLRVEWKTRADGLVEGRVCDCRRPNSKKAPRG